MTENQIRDLTFRRFELHLAAEKINAEIKDINSKLITEAASRPQEHEALDDSDGTAWKATAAGCEIRVVFPTDSLKESIKAGSKVFHSIEGLLVPTDVSKLFDHILAYKPKSDFRKLVGEMFTPKHAEKIVKLCTTASSPKVLVKEAA